MTAVQPTVQRPAAVRAATAATYVAFAGCELLLPSWLARVSRIRDNLRLHTGQLGAIRLAGAAGALVSRPFSGRVVPRLGQRRTVAWTSVASGVTLVLIGLGDRLCVAVFGIGRSIMPRFHAGYSVGTVAGALLGAAMIQLDLPLTIVAVVSSATALPHAVRGFLSDRLSITDGCGPHSLMIGVFVLAATGWFGPSLLGLLGDHVTILRALLAVAALQVVALCPVPATRPLAPVAPDRHRALDNQ